MRADKFLWSVRLFKTRTLAGEACRKNQVWVGGIAIKAARELKIGDKIRIRRQQLFFEFIVRDFPKSRVGAKLAPLYLENITSPEEIERMELLRRSRVSYVNSYREGRPSKKDRRQIDEYAGDWVDFFEENEANAEQ